MKIKEILKECNKEFESLKGCKFKNSIELCNLEEKAIASIINKYKLKVSQEGIGYESKRKDLHKEYIKLFNINLDYKKDKRYKYGIAGEIIDIKAELAEDIKKYENVEFENLDNACNS